MAKDSAEMHGYKKRQSLKRKLWSAALAHDSFSKTRTTAKSYLDAGLNDNHPLHYACMSSIVITYGKPFTSCDEMPVLPSKYTQFGNTDHALLHNSLLTARNNIYAHTDTAFPNFTLDIHIEKRGSKIILNTIGHAPLLNAIVIEYIVPLCDFQLERMQEYRDGLIKALLPQEYVEKLLNDRDGNRTTLEIKAFKIADPGMTTPPNEW